MSSTKDTFCKLSFQTICGSLGIKDVKNVVTKVAMTFSTCGGGAGVSACAAFSSSAALFSTGFSGFGLLASPPAAPATCLTSLTAAFWFSLLSLRWPKNPLLYK